MIDEIYNAQILAAAAAISHIGRLDDPHASAFKQAKYCGSTIIIDVMMQDGVITDFAQEVQACALGQAAASIVSRQIIGTTGDEIKTLHQTVTAMLQGQGEPPQGRFADFAMLQPAKDYKARHGSIVLVLDALIDCIQQIEAKEGK